MMINYTAWLRSYVGHQRLLQLAASAFIRNDQGHVLLGQRSDVMLWAPPSGVVQLGETPGAHAGARSAGRNRLAHCR
jgi:ADP-ribose pyrophosphatase YjhB (NUDIX family)